MAFVRAALAFVLLVEATSLLRAAEITFFCTDALAPSMRVLVPQFESASGHHVKTIVANAGTIATRVQSGETADLAVVLAPAWDRLRQDGRIDPAVRIVLGRVGLGAFVKRGAAKLEIGTVEAFKRTILSAKSLAVRDPAQRSPVGTYMLTLFERLALSDAVKAKLILTTNPPYEQVSKGEAELGFSTLAEIASEPGAELVGPLPPEIQTYNVFVSAIPAGSTQRSAADEFLQFLGSDAAKAVLRSKGIEVD